MEKKLENADDPPNPNSNSPSPPLPAPRSESTGNSGGEKSDVCQSSSAACSKLAGATCSKATREPRSNEDVERWIARLQPTGDGDGDGPRSRLPLATPGTSSAQPNNNGSFNLFTESFMRELGLVPVQASGGNFSGGLQLQLQPQLQPLPTLTADPRWVPMPTWTKGDALQDGSRPRGTVPSPWKMLDFPHLRFRNAPILHVFARKQVSFVNYAAYFIIQCFNYPLPVTLTQDMFSARVEGPAGERIYCGVEKCDSHRIPSFFATFNPQGRTGLYRARARLNIPVSVCIEAGLDPNVYMQMTETCQVVVSRNYLKDALADSLLIRCNFHQRDPSNPSSSKLWGLACDMKTNNLFYTDRSSHEIVCVSPQGEIIRRFGRNGVGRARLNRPTGIACDNANNRLIICDKDNHRICFFTLTGQFISWVGSRGHMNGLFEYPWDVAASKNGDYFVVSDSRNKRIQLFDRFGNFVNKFSIFENNPFEYKEQLDFPRGVSFDDSGENIYVSDFNVNNILRFPLDLSRYQKVLPEGQVVRPQGIAVDGIGNVLVADSRNHCVRHVDTRGGELVATIKQIKANGSKSIGFTVNVCMMGGGYVAVLDGSGAIHIF